VVRLPAEHVSYSSGGHAVHAECSGRKSGEGGSKRVHGFSKNTLNLGTYKP